MAPSNELRFSVTGGVRVTTDFVDRVEDMAELRAMTAALAEGRGSALVVEGVSGIGKTALLREFARQVAEDPGRPRCRVVSARCLPVIGHSLTYGLITDVLLELQPAAKRPSRIRQLLGFTGRNVVAAAPDVLSTLVPGLGAAFVVGRNITEAALSSGAMPGDSLLPHQHGIAVRLGQALLDMARAGAPVLLMIDDVQCIDQMSLLVLFRLLESLPGQPLSLVLGYATDGSGAANAGAREVRELLHRWELEGLVRRRTLGGLPQAAVAELVQRRRGPSDLAAQLSKVTRGHPIFVTLCLKQWQAGDGPRVNLPATVSDMVRGRTDRLGGRDRTLLQVGAVQGETFLSRTVAEVADVPHSEVMERLSRISRDHGLILPARLPSWAQQAASDCYQFEHRALQEAVYAQQTRGQQRARHARSAAALTALAAPNPADAPLELRLEIARHLRLGGQECVSASAAAHYALARSAAIDGLSFTEAEQHCAEAIRAARKLPGDDGDRDRRLVEAIELLLSLTEVRWRGQHAVAGGPDIDALAAEAEQAALGCADPVLVARTTLLRGKTLLATRGVEPALGKLREAVERATATEDAVALFVAKVEYGRQLSKRDLAGALAQLREAEELYTTDPRLGGSGDPVLQHARNLGEMQLGVTLFDSGHLGEARRRLLRCTARLRDEPLRAELPIALNYLAQLHLAMGDDQPARTVLREALDFEEARGGDSGWHANNSALLALSLCREPERRAESLAMIEAAWLETQRTWLANLVPIVRNLLAQVLLETAGGGEAEADALDRAYRLAGDTVVETRRTGMVRSEIAALSLRSRIRLQQGDTEAATRYAREALSILGEIGDMPALRTEEVLFHAARALGRNGAAEDARSLLERARTEVSRKAGHIDDADQRRRFLAERLNRRILSDQELA